MSGSSTHSERNLRVLLADEDKSALERLAGVLDGLGHEVVPFAVSVQEAIDLIAREDPDLAIVVVHHDDQHGLALIGETVEFASGPVIVHLRAGDGLDVVARAADLGIAAYLDSTEPQDVQATIEVALRRYEQERKLTEKVEELESALERRAVIEREQPAGESRDACAQLGRVGRREPGRDRLARPLEDAVRHLDAGGAA